MISSDVILDTDIGTDIDDAFALGLVLRSPGLKLHGVSTVSGDTVARARIVVKMLGLGGQAGVPVIPGMPSRTSLTHGEWAADIHVEAPDDPVDGLLDFYWRCIDKGGSSKTCVVVLGPLTNIAIVREQDPAKFDEKVSVLMMGGSIRRGYFGLGLPMPEYNIVQDKAAARAILESNASVRVVPLDVTARLKLTAEHLSMLETTGKTDPLVQGLLDMTCMFRKHLIGHRAPVMFDPATVAFLVDETLGQFHPMSLRVSRFGFTRVAKLGGLGAPPCKDVCVELDANRFFDMFLSRLASPASQPAGG